MNEQLAAFAFLKHLGIYGYRRGTLLRLVKFPVSPLETAEKLEQLRALENGIQIAVVTVDYDSVGVDVPEDVAKVEKIISRETKPPTHLLEWSKPACATKVNAPHPR